MSDGTSVDLTGAIRLKAPPRKAPPRKVPLPAIRDELILFAAAPNEDATPAWMI